MGGTDKMSAISNTGTRSLRRSRRLQGLAVTEESQLDGDLNASSDLSHERGNTSRHGRSKTPKAERALATENLDSSSSPNATRARKRKKVNEKDTKAAKNTAKDGNTNCLPRLREEALVNKFTKGKTTDNSTTSSLQIIGVDEAGRGPLAGPVVAAAAIIPFDIPGIMDSKKLTKEHAREELYEKIISSPKARWAVAIHSSSRIDEINILQATLEAMRNAVQSIITIPSTVDNGGMREEKISSKFDGCYVVCGMNDDKGKPVELDTRNIVPKNYSFHALIDGNKVPKEMPCEAESMVKGDSKEYAIAAASIVAKVTRDRLMHEYHAMYPEYNLSQHKGYPTAAHMAKVKELGATAIHRRTFAPLKFMTFDDDGKVIKENN